VDLRDSIKPITYFKNHMAEAVRNVSENGKTYVITQNGEAKAVVMDAGRYSDLMKALAMLRILSFGEADVRAGRTVPHAQVVAEIEAVIRKAKANGKAVRTSGLDQARAARRPRPRGLRGAGLADDRRPAAARSGR
jgi:prevent-host-death family protein